MQQNIVVRANRRFFFACRMDRVGYYRLMGCLHPLRKTGSDDFTADASFGAAVEVYEFDHKLRGLILAGGGIDPSSFGHRVDGGSPLKRCELGT